MSINPLYTGFDGLLCSVTPHRPELQVGSGLGELAPEQYAAVDVNIQYTHVVTGPIYLEMRVPVHKDNLNDDGVPKSIPDVLRSIQEVLELTIKQTS